MRERDRGPRSQLARYTFGYSDEKPHWSFWLMIAGMVAFVLWNAVKIT